MPGHGSAGRDLRGFLIADLADENDVRVLPQERAQHARKVEANFFIHLHLHNAVHAVLHRIFTCQNLDVRLVQHLQRAIQRRGLSAASGAGD